MIRRLMTTSLLFPCALLLDDMMALRAIETRSIILKAWPYLGPKVRNSSSTNHIARFVNYYCYDVNVIEFSIRLKN